MNRFNEHLTRTSVFITEVLVFFVLTLATSFADSNIATFTSELYKESNWQACATECSRFLIAHPDRQDIRLTCSLAQLKMGKNSIPEIKSISANLNNSSELRVSALLALGSYYSKKAQYQQSIIYLKKAFEQSESADLFNKSLSSIMELERLSPDVLSPYPSLKVQIRSASQTCKKNMQIDNNNNNNQDSVLSIPFRMLITFYQTQIGPAIGQRCSLYPSCSAYAVQSLKKHSILGLSIYADRMVREPDVVAEKKSIIIFDHKRKYADPLIDHDYWLKQ